VSRKKGNAATTVKRTPRSAPPPPPKKDDSKEGWWRTYRPSRSFYEALFAALFVGLIILLATLWLTELGQHQHTKGQLDRVEKREQQLNSANTKLREKNQELERLHPLLQLYGYGTRAKLVASYDLKKEVGARIAIGKCPQTPCLIFTINSIERSPKTGDDYATLGIGGIWEGVSSNAVGAFNFWTLLKKGCRTKFRMSVYEVDFVIEDDTHSSVKAGIGISPASSLFKGLDVSGHECSKEENAR
jgi:hypothetical protein